MTETTKRDEWEAFEAWAKDAPRYGRDCAPGAWDAWQARAALATAPEQAGEPVEMALCSTEQVFLKPNQLYRFYVKEGCAECARVADPTSAPPPASTNRRTDEPSTGICFFCGETMSGKHEADCPQATHEPLTDEQILAIARKAAPPFPWGIGSTRAIFLDAVRAIIAATEGK